MSFHDLVRALRDLDDVRVTTTAIASRLEVTQQQFSVSGGPDGSLLEEALEEAYAGLRAVDEAAAQLAARVGASEFVLRATLHVTSLAVWQRLRPLAEEFAAHPDWEAEVTVPSELVGRIHDSPLPLVGFSEWLVEGRVTDVSITVQRYQGSVSEQLRQASWTTVLLALYALPAEIDDYWQVVGDAPLPYPAPASSLAFATRLAALPAGTVTLLWRPASYGDLFGDGVDSVRVVELARRHDDVVLLWDRSAAGTLPAREQAYLADIAAALVDEGTAIEVHERDLSQAMEEARGGVGGSADLAEVFATLGRPMLEAPTDAALERLRHRAASATPPALALPVALPERLRDSFVSDFLGSES
jgi:hypothetical protein